MYVVYLSINLIMCMCTCIRMCVCVCVCACVRVWLCICVCVHCKKRGVTEHPKGAIFYCFHGNPYCYHGNSKILLLWGVQLHRIFYSVCVWGGGGSTKGLWPFKNDS